MDRAEILAASPVGAYRILDTSPRGLSTVEAARRLTASGSNTLPPPARASLLRRFAVQFTDLFAVMLLAAAMISFLAYVAATPHDVGNAQLALAILGVVVLNAAIGFVQEYSAERTVQALQAMVPTPAGCCATASARTRRPPRSYLEMWSRWRPATRYQPTVDSWTRTDSRWTTPR
jgi:magnesium-transporting ATPase (P-type)